MVSEWKREKVALVNPIQKIQCGMRRLHLISLSRTFKTQLLRYFLRIMFIWIYICTWEKKWLNSNRSLLRTILNKQKLCSTFKKQKYLYTVLHKRFEFSNFSSRALIYEALKWCKFQIYVVSSGGESNAIGSCGIGPMEHGLGRQHWQDMIHNARQPIALWHFLR